MVRVDPPTELPAGLFSAPRKAREQILTSVATSLPLVRTAKELLVSDPRRTTSKSAFGRRSISSSWWASYLPLRREGRNYKALCPWHDDTRPSLHVNPERQSFKCWVCDIGGDIFSFMMKMENVEFPEALAMLAEAGGNSAEPIERRADRPARSTKSIAVSRDGLGRGAVSSISATGRRGRAGAAISGRAEDFGRKCAAISIGFRAESLGLADQAGVEHEFSTKILETVGLIVRQQDGPGHYDRFRGRVLFPIRDVQGRPVAFGGRILPQFAEENPAKYVNSPETPLFSKSSMLYALGFGPRCDRPHA